MISKYPPKLQSTFYLTYKKSYFFYSKKQDFLYVKKYKTSVKNIQEVLIYKQWEESFPNCLYFKRLAIGTSIICIDK